MRRAVLALVFAIAACGPAWAPPDAPTVPCPIIDEAGYRAAREDGAAHARADVYANGTVNLVTGPGVVQCARYSSTMRPCRRQVDFVIEYRQAGQATFYVRVPANAEYRFNVHAAPNTCQILQPG